MSTLTIRSVSDFQGCECGKLDTHKTPKEAWNWLEKQYKMQPKRTLHISLNQVERLHPTVFHSANDGTQSGEGTVLRRTIKLSLLYWNA